MIKLGFLGSTESIVANRIHSTKECRSGKKIGASQVNADAFQ